MYSISVRKMASIGSSIKQQTKKKCRFGGLSKSDETAAHKVYSNPFNKKSFAISQLKMTDVELVARRQQMEWFESAKIQLRYF